MVDKEELKNLLRDPRSEPITILKEEYKIILKNLDDLERVLEQAINIIQRIRRIRTTRSKQLLHQEGQMPAIVERR